jgi:DNA mismatch repair ATPase MutS
VARTSERRYHFIDTIGPEGLRFEYRLSPGAATTRNAITLLELHGAPDSMVRRALTRAAALDQQRRRAKALS